MKETEFKVSFEDFNNIEININDQSITNLLNIKVDKLLEQAYSYVKVSLCHFLSEINETNSKVVINFTENDKFTFKVADSPIDLVDRINKVF